MDITMVMHFACEQSPALHTKETPSSHSDVINHFLSLDTVIWNATGIDIECMYSVSCSLSLPVNKVLYLNTHYSLLWNDLTYFIYINSYKL